MAAVLMLEGRNSSVEHLGPIFAVREQRRTGNTCKHDPTRKKSGGTLIPEQFPCQSHYLLDHLTMPLYLAWDLCPFRSALLIARLLCRRTRGNQIQHNSAPNQHLVARGVHRRFPRTSYGEVPTLTLRRLHTTQVQHMFNKPRAPEVQGIIEHLAVLRCLSVLKEACHRVLRRFFVQGEAKGSKLLP